MQGERTSLRLSRHGEGRGGSGGAALFFGGYTPTPQAPQLVQPPSVESGSPAGSQETAGTLRGSPDRSKLRSQARFASREPGSVASRSRRRQPPGASAGQRRGGGGPARGRPHAPGRR